MRQQQMQGPPIGDDGKPMVAIHEGSSGTAGGNTLYGGTTRWITQTEYDRTIGRWRRVGRVIGGIFLVAIVGVIALAIFGQWLVANGYEGEQWFSMLRNDLFGSE